jgi:hypothetical protein
MMLTCSLLTTITEQPTDNDGDSGDSVVFQVEGAHGKNARNSQRYKQRLRERANDGDEAALDVLKRKSQAQGRRRAGKVAGKTAGDIGT